MAAIASNLSLRPGKRRLLESCAIAAGLAALALGGPAWAQVAGTGTFVDGGAGSSIVDNGAANSTTVTVTQNQSIINWVPTDSAATGAPIDFLPAGENWYFVGTGDYTVLNRFVNGAGGSLSRQIALNGTVNSYIGATTGTQGGNIWFYNAGGILIGGGAAINVGGLVLTANDIDTTGGLFGPGGEIRFRGASGSTAAIEIAAGAAIDAAKANPGGSYVALVAPRIVQSGLVEVDGSAAYVAAEEVDIRINSGLFDIEVGVGAEGGTVITHSGITRGPAHQQDDVDQSRIYMVAIPKNDAVTMLVSGQVGYQDALVAQTDPDGAVRLSAGYNIVGGEIDSAAASSVAANMTVNDTIFQSSVVAHASGAFVGEPLATIPGPGGIFVPPPQLGLLIVQGDGTFIGDASATLNVGTGQLVGATGDLSVQSGGVGSAPGSASINVTGGQLIALGDLNLTATGLVQSDGSGLGGPASLSVTGGTVQAGAINVLSAGTGGIGDSGDGGDGTGGDASILVSGTGSALSADTISVQSVGTGGGLFLDISGVATGAADNGGDGIGGNATLTVDNGANLTANDLLSVGATGYGQTGNLQSGSGTGGTAQLIVGGSGTSFTSPVMSVSADGFGGGDYSEPPAADILTQNGGTGTGGSAALVFTGDALSSASLGDTIVSASGIGGSASAGENAAGGDAQGGNAGVSVDGGMVAEFDPLTVLADALSGGGTSPSGTTGRSGDAQGGTIAIAATNGGLLTTDSTILLSANGAVEVSENMGSGTGGGITVGASGGGTIRALGAFTADANGGSEAITTVLSTGTGTGGSIDFIADGGTISGLYYTVAANGTTVDASGAGGIAQGGNVGLLAENGGLIEASDPAVASIFSASAESGSSAGGVDATGGAMQIIANGGTINLAGSTTLSASGATGGDINFGAATAPVGRGGSLLIRTVAEPTDGSTMTFGDLGAGADGALAPTGFGAANGEGGTVAIELQGGSFTVNGSPSVSADGYGGAGGGAGSGSGGTLTFTQTGGDTNVGDMALSASGFGGVDANQSGDGFGGTATMSLLGGALTAADVVVTAGGQGGPGGQGDDSEPASPVPAGNGGNGTGGTATINIDGLAATVDVSTLAAYAHGGGGDGGVYQVLNGVAGDGGDGGDGIGGNAGVNMLNGTLTTASLIVDASGFGGAGGDVVTGLILSSGTGGSGGYGQGGTATLGLAKDVEPGADVTVLSRGDGGNGGLGTIGGNGADGLGGIAQVVVTAYDAGTLLATIDSSADGGLGGFGDNGEGGDGGRGYGGTSRVEADGAGAAVTVTPANFITGGTGGDGGAAHTYASAALLTGPRGGDGGDGIGGTIEIAANDGSVTLAPATSGSISLGSIGTGGDGGTGADNFSVAGIGGDGGMGGTGIGGTVRLLANGGTIGSDGAAVTISVGGVPGSGGNGGAGAGGSGAFGSTFGDQGGRVLFSSLASASGPGLIDLGDTAIDADGLFAGRIEMLTDGSISMASLDASAAGLAAPTNNDTDVAPAGIFLGAYGGTIRTDGAMSLTTGSSVGIYAQAAGQLNVGGDLTVAADDQVDIRHDFRSGDAPTIMTGGSVSMTALNSIRSAPGSLIAAGTALTLNVTGVNGLIDIDSLVAGDSSLLLAENINLYGSSTSGTDFTVDAEGAATINDVFAGDDISISAASLELGTLGADGTGLDSELDGSNITLNSTGATTVEHAEASDNFTANAGSFATGLNSIITGGNIDILAAGAADLGNSTAGGHIDVDAQSIGFAALVAGDYVDLNAAGGTPAGAIAGTSIDAGADITLAGSNIDVASITGTASLSATATDGALAIGSAAMDGNISAVASGDLTGDYGSGGDILLQSGANIDASARAAGGFLDPVTDTPTAGNVFADAAGNATLADSDAAGMFGVRAGGSAAVTDAAAGEDMLVIAGTTATLTGIAVGDDLDVRAASAATVTGAAATGSGPDGFALSYTPGGFAIEVGESGASAGGADIGIASTGDSVTANGLSASDDIVLTAATTLTVDAPALAGGDIAITAASADLASLSTPGGGAIDVLDAGGNIAIVTSGGTQAGAIRAGGGVTVDAGAAIAIDRLVSGGTTDLAADAGAVTIGSLASAGAVSASGDTIAITGNGSLTFASVQTDVGGAAVQTNGNLTIANGDVAGAATFEAANNLNVAALTADAAALTAGGDLAMTDVTTGATLSALATGTATIDGLVTGPDLSVTSGDIVIASSGQLGSAGTTGNVAILNGNPDVQTFVGGTGSRSGYHIDSDELTRVYGTAIRIFAPELASNDGSIAAAGGGGTIASVGSSTPPALVIDDFTVTGGSPASNLGANGSLTIETRGKARVIGDVRLTGLTDANALDIIANDALEVILGEGTIRLTGAGSAPGGMLNLVSDDVIVATAGAIGDVGAAATIDAIDDRLAQNDGIVLDDGALYAGGIDVSVVGGFYVQNSGAGTRYADRRGLTFGTLGLNVNVETPDTRIVINGVHLGPSGRVTGLDAIGLLTVGGSVPAAGAFDRGSTMNGCLIVSQATCAFLEQGENFPVQDVIEETTDADGDGISLPTALITMRELDPLTGEPLLDDPVTGAGNDDLWTPPAQ